MSKTQVSNNNTDGDAGPITSAADQSISTTIEQVLAPEEQEQQQEEQQQQPLLSKKAMNRLKRQQKRLETKEMWKQKRKEKKRLQRKNHRAKVSLASAAIANGEEDPEGFIQSVKNARRVNIFST